MNKINIYDFGAYNMGLAEEEINEYLKYRTGKKGVKLLRKKFDKIAGCNTMAVGPQGQLLMYRHDVKRFADVLLLGIPTIFD